MELLADALIKDYSVRIRLFPPDSPRSSPGPCPSPLLGCHDFQIHHPSDLVPRKLPRPTAQTSRPPSCIFVRNTANVRPHAPHGRPLAEPVPVRRARGPTSSGGEGAPVVLWGDACEQSARAVGGDEEWVRAAAESEWVGGTGQHISPILSASLDLSGCDACKPDVLILLGLSMFMPDDGHGNEQRKSRPRADRLGQG
jgi:hypothetical protein